MVLLHPCIPCQHGDHEHCQGGTAAPEGMLGGWRCSCTCNDAKAKGTVSSIEVDENGPVWLALIIWETR